MGPAAPGCRHDTIDWGTAPTWISGLGTTGALWVGAVTLRRNQNKERRSEADAVVCRDERGDCCGYGLVDHWLAAVENGSPRPVYNVYLVTFNSETGTMGETSLIANVLQPGVRDHIHVHGGALQWSHPAAVIFRDAEDTWWMRDVLEQSLYRQSPLPRAGRVRRTLRRLEKEGRLTIPQRLRLGGHGHHAPW
ncbi:hypothetical protein ROS62_27265 [Streptomyces sp. DSM 41972]|uniref:Uncharacterized protein n=1 Tax=Streptomyces althioticus subsp. attaecolombicae TaxID=3075534 RepID=A0ABU3I9A7_9ACTN|nr:hypothetical protein [Streptomyces sp. DSM 41972]SCD38021.1 hypothetical protein GA0115238_106116 [Streptomyces sp. di50b]SCE49586.1 hypothetical protein GA0115245_144217 [Streptomyces sp. di188]